MKIPARDKWVHFLTGIPMGIILLLLVMHYFSFSTVLNVFIVLLAVAIISFGFEIISLLTKKGKYDIYDAVASTSGAVLGIVFVLILQFYRR
ncbi:MAG: hypothetical protein IPL97_01600 [Niastella sp.]|nr:hypothetical protein [Niastella sp.]